MYHRYQPTENGQFQRQTLPDAPSKSPSGARSEHPSPLPAAREQHTRQREPQPPAKEHRQAPPPIHTPSHRTSPQDTENAPAPRFQLPFLEKLLPNMDSGDLLLLFIMLLLISEGNEDSSSVVMTLAIFLFLQ